eukprot:Opistho-2@63156
MPQPNTSWRSFLLAGDRFVVGDTVLVRPDRKGPDYIAAVQCIRTDANEEILIELQWYYRPEETVFGRQPYHGDDEVLESDHKDTIHVSSVNSRCFVRTLAEYTAEQDNQSTPEFPMFFSRSKYLYKKKKIEPKTLPLICVCRQPENPDIPMICCDECDRCYHTNCIGMTKEKLKKLEKYVCAKCEQVSPTETDAPAATAEKPSRKRKR